MMSLSNELNDFFEDCGYDFNPATVSYAKQVVYNIKTSPILDNFLSDNEISASVLLNEIVPYSDFKFKQYGNEKLDMKELQSILNIIMFSNELEKLIMEDHVRMSSIGEAGEIFYIADAYAAEYFQEKYSFNIKEGVEFDFTILEDNDLGYDLGFGEKNSLN